MAIRPSLPLTSSIHKKTVMLFSLPLSPSAIHQKSCPRRQPVKTRNSSSKMISGVSVATVLIVTDSWEKVKRVDNYEEVLGELIFMK
jgi:hypothetical protein